MKKLTFWKSLFLLFALIVGSTSAWADDDYTITFNSTDGADGTSAISTISDIVASGSDYISSITNSDKVYKGKSGYGVKLGSSSVNGTFTMNLSNDGQVTATKIAVNACRYNGSKASKIKITINGSTTKTIDITSGSLDDYEWTLTSATDITSIAVEGQAGTSGDRRIYLKSLTVTYSTSGGDTPSITASDGNILYNATDGSIGYTIGNEPTPAGTLTAAIKTGTTPTIANFALGTATSSTVPFTCTANTSVTAKTATVTLTYTYNTNETVTKDVTITQGVNPIYGTSTNPYTVAQAREVIDANEGLTGKYVTGIVCEGGSSLSSGAMNYWISDDGTETNKFEIYKGKGISGADFEDTDDVQVGDVVVVKGDIKKFGDTYEFDSGSELVSLDRPVIPTIVVTPTSLTGFTYGVGFGPSTTKTFTVEGSNLTANISLSLGESSNFEMSLSENSDYTDELSLTPTTGTVEETTVYVRLKAGLAVNASYEGTITLTSTDATNKSVSLAGSVTGPNFDWDLNTDNTTTATTDEMTWVGTYATMAAAKANSTTNTNNYYPGTSGKTYSSTRFYSNSVLTIAPTSGYAIDRIVFTATSNGYASTLANSSWTNATATGPATNTETTATVTPINGALPISATIGGTCGFTAVKVYYAVATSVTLTPAKEYTTLTSSHNLDFTGISGLKAYIAIEVDGDKVKMTQVNKVPAGTGLVLKAANSNSAVVVPVFDGTGADDVSGNQMEGSATTITAVAANDGYILSNGVFQPASAGILAAGKSYLNIAVSSARSLVMSFDDATTGIANLNVDDNFDANAPMYNLAGQRVNKSYKGVVIVNGKKMLNK